jgi:RNA polymerase sigma-70 factor (ECF subfamily)
MTVAAITEIRATDQELIAQTVGGRAEAFGELVLRYQDRLLRTASHLVRSHVDAEDLVQDVLIQAYAKLSTFRQQCAFYTWLYRITLNLWHVRRRCQRVRARLVYARPVTEDDQLDPHGTPEAELQRREEAREMAEAWRGLSAEHRRILALRGIDRFDYGTIAQILQLKIGTVRSRLHRARRHLRDRLDAIQGVRSACSTSA